MDKLEPIVDQETDVFVQQCHPACFACREEPGGLGLKFRTLPDGSVIGEFMCDSTYQGFPDRLHGGVVAMLLDSTMAHCLFTKRLRGVTARLTVRYHLPVELGAKATIRAWLVHSRGRLHTLKSELTQDDTLMAAAHAEFLLAPDSNDEP